MQTGVMVKQEELARLCRRHRIRRLALFGSALRGELRADSDVDLLVDFEAGQVPGFIKEQEADVMLSGGMGGRAIQFFAQFGIEPATGAVGTVAEAVACYLDGKLSGASSCAESEAHGHGHDH